MKLSVALILFAIGATGYSQVAISLPPPGLRDEIDFIYEPSFAPSWIVHLERDSKGKVAGEVYRSDSEESPSKNSHRSFKATSTVFETLVAQIESREFTDAAEMFPMIGNDGDTYVFTRWFGNRYIRFRVWSPSASPNQPSARIAIKLADGFMKAAGVSGIEEFEKRPNKALVPTATSVTPVADAPVAPAAAAAHL